jgi:hypothetical protein
MRVVVTGWVAPFPTAATLWHPLAFALGFRDLGSEVWFFEDSGDRPWGYDPESRTEDDSCTAGVRFLARELADVGLGDRWWFRHAPTGTFHGTDEETARDVLAEADVLVNVSLTMPLRPEYERVPQRLAIDTDPVFTQVRIAGGDARLDSAPEWHTRLFTFGRPPLPAQRHDWVPTRQPVCTRLWPVAGPAQTGSPFTTISTWRAYPPVIWHGVEYAAKDRSFRQLLTLPTLTELPLSVAIGAGQDHEHGRRLLAAHGWGLTDPLAANSTTAAYRNFISGSFGEIGVAKHGYVTSRSGWFSERTCLYLASGRPAVVQDTGWSDWLPSGQGLLPYTTVDEAAKALEEVAADPRGHAKAARALVEDNFEAADVCSELLEAL